MILKRKTVLLCLPFLFLGPIHSFSQFDFSEKHEELYKDILRLKTPLVKRKIKGLKGKYKKKTGSPFTYKV